jgi:hypothetical protein
MYMKKIVAISAAAMLLAACGTQKGQTGPNKPPNKGNTQEVHLIWKSLENKWKLKFGNGQEQDPKTAKTTLAPTVGPTKFIVDIAGKSVTFKDPDGLTVWENSKSGPPGSTQILGPEITKGGKLVFYDLNYGNSVTIYYSLNLSDGSSVDPIIDNGGGTWLR